jgi:hypothetical protein
MRYLRELLANVSKLCKPSPKGPSSRPGRLGLESLESRELLSVSPLLPQLQANFGAIHAQVALDMTTAAHVQQATGQIAKPTGPTLLFLNFDGWTNTPYSDVAQTTNIGMAPFSLADEQNVLYRVSEIFAPFNVEVQQIHGDGNFSTAHGATTVFVGVMGKAVGGVTPGQFSDYPFATNPNGGTNHGFNSDPYDIAFVDGTHPHGFHTSDNPLVDVADAVAHEAGHTFGLSHVRTDGQADYPSKPLNGSLSHDDSLPPDVMSYDSNNDFFSNRTFNLTEASGSGVDVNLFPEMGNTNITLQNSFTYLTTVLGARPAGSQVGVIDENIDVSSPLKLDVVDTNVFRQAPTISAVSTVSGTLARAGDYAVYRLDLSNPVWSKGGIILALTPTPTSHVNLMIFDEAPNGQVLTGNLVSAGFNGAQLGMVGDATRTFYLVVGTANGVAGPFSLTIGAVTTNVQGANFTMTDAKQNVSGQLAITLQNGDSLSGTFTPKDNTYVPNSTPNTPVNITGKIGGLVNGSSPFSFTGYRSTSKTTDDGEVTTYILNEYQVTFNGQVTASGLHFNLTGSGSYTVKVTTTVKRHGSNRGTQTSHVAETLPLVAGSALNLGNIRGPVGSGGGGVSKVQVAQAPAATVTAMPPQTSVGVLDALMAGATARKNADLGAVDSPFQTLGNML